MTSTPPNRGHFFCHLADFLHFFVYDNAALLYR
uniref:Uncharacterized protein n=1 Tax=Myoviridae sp. ctWPU11 TaxID=2825118 RepID=A0A8S5UAC8_9CAUD|nr:MAG TPA: hypothetical protein [Myoviridae sp. ctWPU11]